MRVIKLPDYFLLTDRHSKSTIISLSKLVEFSEIELGIDFSQLQEIEKGDFMVLIAQLEKSILSQKNKIFRHGKLPDNKRIKELLTKPADQIFHVDKALTLPKITDSEKAKLINPDLIDSIVKDLKKIGIKEYYYPFNIFLTELIGNAVEHGIENKKINWWLTHEINRKNKIARYTFVDMGLGIIESHKKAGLPLKYYFQRKENVVLDALFGRLGSSTKLTNRGRGLPQLRGMIENGFVENLVLITNSVTLKYSNGVFETSRNPNFVGTYYSWTIDQNSFQKWKNIK